MYSRLYKWEIDRNWEAVYGQWKMYRLCQHILALVASSITSLTVSDGECYIQCCDAVGTKRGQQRGGFHGKNWTLWLSNDTSHPVSSARAQIPKMFRGGKYTQLLCANSIFLAHVHDWHAFVGNLQHLCIYLHHCISSVHWQDVPKTWWQRLLGLHSCQR